MHQQISISSVFLGLLIFSAYTEEILIQIVVKKPINIVSDRYVSFSIDPGHLLELCSTPRNTENITMLTQKLGLAYLKIGGRSTNSFTLDDKQNSSSKDQMRVTPSDWLALHDWIRTTKLKPIITLPYSSNQWSPRNLISIMGITNRLGIDNCTWQLGSELNSTEVINYVDDLSTLKTIVDVFKNNGNNWGVVGADIAKGSNPDAVHLYTELSKHISEANGWTQPIEYNSFEIDDSIFFEKDASLRSLLKSKVPTWLNVPLAHQFPKSQICGKECELSGLQWANTLGTSAQTGFKVVFKQIDIADLMIPSLSYYVSVIHKKIMGQKVFDTKVLNADNFSPKYYTHCTKNMSGSFSVMGVNFADYKTKLPTKLPSKYTGSEVYQYILTVHRGDVLLNGVPVNIFSNLEPIVKIKKESRPTTFTLPPRSIGFWVFPMANLRQCSKNSDAETATIAKNYITNDLDITTRTASENLLHELISEIEQLGSSKDINKQRSRRHAVVKKDSKHMSKRNADPGYKERRDVSLFKKFNEEAFSKRKLASIGRPRRRVTRQINNNNRLSNLFKNFELPQPKKFKMGNFWNLPQVKQNTIAKNPKPSSIPPVVSTIHDVYRVDPDEQIFKSTENSELPSGDVYFEVGEERNMDYVEFDDKQERKQKHRNPKNQIDNQKFVKFDANDVDDQNTPDHMYEFYNDRAKTHTVPEISPYSELWESDAYQKAPPPEPTNRRDQFNSETNNHERNIDLIVKELPPTWRQNQENLLKAKNSLSSIYVSDGDKMSLNMNLPIRKYDMNDDGFFISKRKRRSIDTNFNDEIENKLHDLKESGTDIGAEEVEAYVNFLNKNGNKFSLLEKVTKIIDSLEKIDDIGKYNNIEKLSADIKDLESFLFRRNPKFQVFKPKSRISHKDIRKKCKILSINLEQQCLKENDFYSNRVIKRDTKYTNEHKTKKSTSLKKVFHKEKTDKINRARRSATYESWEDDRSNMILKELYTANEGKSNAYVPRVSFRKQVPIEYRPIEEKNIFTEKISILENLPLSNTPRSIVKEVIEEEKAPKLLIDSHLEGAFINKDIDEHHEGQEYHTPKFMKKISNSVNNWMNVVENHVSGWWNLLS